MDAAGWMLVAGFVVFLVGAALWKPAVYQQPLREALTAMAADRPRLRWIQGWMIAGVVISTAAVFALGAELHQAGEGALGLVAAAVFALGAAVWVVALCFHLTVTEWAAAETAHTGTVPEGYEAWHRWAGSLYAVHMLLGYLTAALLGIVLLRTGLTPRWFALGEVALGASCAAGFVVLRGGPFGPPILVHALTAATGVALLLSG